MERDLISVDHGTMVKDSGILYGERLDLRWVFRVGHGAKVTDSGD